LQPVYKVKWRGKDLRHCTWHAGEDLPQDMLQHWTETNSKIIDALQVGCGGWWGWGVLFMCALMGVAAVHLCWRGRAMAWHLGPQWQHVALVPSCVVAGCWLACSGEHLHACYCSRAGGVADSQASPEELLRLLGKEPEVQFENTEQQQAWQQRQPADGGTAACGLRQAGKFSHRTGGALFAFCACGLMFPPQELPCAESTTMVLIYLLQLFSSTPFAVRGERMIITFDDMCHLLRFIQLRKDLHPKLGEFLDQVTPVVDKFHFNKNHKGKFCSKYTNPYTVQELQAADINLSVAEQRFKQVARHKHHMNAMNKNRFRFMLMKLADLDMEFRRLGLF
jgi:hypothetical protein